jgi:hypothetical protein
MRVHIASFKGIGSEVELQHGPQCDYVDAGGMHVTSPSTSTTARCLGLYMWLFSLHLASLILPLLPPLPQAGTSR